MRGLIYSDLIETKKLCFKDKLSLMRGHKYSDLTTTKKLGTMDKWSLTKGGYKGRFDCIFLHVPIY